MRLVSFTRNGRAGFGAVVDEMIRDIGPQVDAHVTLRDLLPEGVEAIRRLTDRVSASDVLPLSSVTLTAPIPNPRKYLGIGGNYASHMAEAARIGFVRPQVQAWFNKQVSCINGPYAPVEKPRVSDQFDYEGEFGFVIARDCRHVRAADAMSFVAGYVVCNDLSVRDWQMKSPTHTIGKSFDTHGPFGPWLVTADEIPDPHALMLRVHVNGELRQEASTGDMTYKIPEMIEELTTAFTLQAGDVLSTGSPAGVGGLMEPQQFLKIGDTVRVEVENVGHIENVVIAEPA